MRRGVFIFNKLSTLSKDFLSSSLGGFTPGLITTTLAGLTSVTSGTVNIADRHIKTTDSTNLVLNEAIDLARKGSSVDDIVKQTKLSKDQAETIVSFHGSKV